MKISKEKEIELAQKFFKYIWYQIELGDDYIYCYVDPECEHGDHLCEILNNDTVLEVLKLGFKEKYGVELKVEE